MKRALGLGLVAVAIALATTVSAESPSNEGGLAADMANEQLVRSMYDRFVEAWNRHDAKSLAAMWAVDGDHLEPDGRVAKGRLAVGKLLARQHETVFAKTRLNLSITDVWFIGDQTALVDGGYELYGAQLPDGTELPARRGHLTSLLLLEQGKWWIAASRLMIPTALPYKKKE